MAVPFSRNEAGPYKRPTSINNNHFTSKRLGNQSALHQSLTQALLVTLKGQYGAQPVQASLPNFPEPIKMGRHEPDLISQDSTGLYHVGESKTGDGDLWTEHAKEQFLDFANRVMTRDRRPLPFHIAVPKKAELELKKVLISLGLLGRSNVMIWTL